MAGSPDIVVAVACPRWTDLVPDVEELCRRVAAVALGAAGGPGGMPMERLEVSLLLADDATVRQLNRQYRGQDKPTNVLAFAALDGGAAASAAADLPGPLMLGDVVVAMETTVAEAEAEGKTVAHHLSHLVVHGVLHLLGYDHMEDADADRMEALERAILAALGIADPYAAEAP